MHHLIRVWVEDDPVSDQMIDLQLFLQLALVAILKYCGFIC